MKTDKEIPKKPAPHSQEMTNKNGLFHRAQDSNQTPSNHARPVAQLNKDLTNQSMAQSVPQRLPKVDATNEEKEIDAEKKSPNPSDLPLPAIRDINTNAPSVENFDFDDEVFDTTLEENITFTGTIKFQKPFMIKGVVKGTIDATSDLVIDTTARVAANIKAKRVLIRGAVRGNITATSLVRVCSTGELTGDIRAGNVVLDPGSNFSGKCTMIK